jgi:cytochrome P450
MKPAFLLGHAHHLNPCVIEGMKKLLVADANPETGLCSFWMPLGLPVISVLKADHARKVLNASSHRKPIKLIAKHMDAFLGPKALVTLVGDEWKVHRRLITHAFKYAHLKAMTSDINSVSTELIESLKVGIHGNINSGINVVDIMKKATLDVIGLTSFNHNFKCCSTNDVPEMASAFRYLLSENSRRSFENPLSPLSYFYSLPTKENIKFNKCKEKIHGLLRRLIKEHRNANEPSNDFMTYMLTAKDGENSKVQLSDQALIDNLVTFLFGGFDTTSIGLSYCLFELANHPNVVNKMRTEMNNVLGERTDITYDDYNELKYTQAVWKEILRLYPPAPLTVRNLTSDLVLDDVTLKQGTMVYIPIWWLHRDPRNWKNPLEFQPERFVETKKEAKVANGVKRTFSNFFSFSGGARNCVGRRFAMLEGTIMLGKLVREFNFRIPSGSPPVEPISLGVVQEAKNGIVLSMETISNRQ